ncbi:Mini-circle protein [Amycolatopsis antarctica]|uniref:Mini-circle protein n=1 Tax=Amycolatopsis antarctica TaxID=1854586 RepID=A0A263CZ87_9PSEU|nr:DinB family protein [Amycolatopsis antarctica]OZM71482.1 Mini-circle protein [Amycolatopsis antarctica]
MTTIPDGNYSAAWPGDERASPPTLGGEREVLTAHLDRARHTLELKCAGVPAEALSRKSIPPSGLSLHGIVRHLAGAEQWWFRTQFAGDPAPLPYYSDEDPDQDFERLDGDPAEALDFWREQCARSREIVAVASLDDTGTVQRTGAPISLRVILVKMIAEYSRHNGHADLLRERIDGAKGE